MISLIIFLVAINALLIIGKQLNRFHIDDDF